VTASLKVKKIGFENWNLGIAGCLGSCCAIADGLTLSMDFMLVNSNVINVLRKHYKPRLEKFPLKRWPRWENAL